MQFERSEAGSCELWRSRLHRALFVVCRECFCFGVAQSEFCFRFLGAESLQAGNQTSVSGVCRIVSCILHNEKLTEVGFDHKPSSCVVHEAWRREGLSVLPKSVVASQAWVTVLEHLRQVCAWY